MLCWISFSHKEGLVGNVKLKGSLDCKDHEIVVFKILRTARRMHSKLTTLDFRTANFGLFREVVSRIPQDKGKRGPRKLVDIQGLSPTRSGVTHPNTKKSGKNVRMVLGEQDAPGHTQMQKGNLQRVEVRMDNLGGKQ
ncbi:glycerol kinase [Willisornis vidua]|uniref:Glycerol kinase n=1 Tax=Willisornis vidua TaxID=1566151 RepID=A0ABQ9DE95_9PASS|nr:glycerol kinase [Willisornis vidua]